MLQAFDATPGSTKQRYSDRNGPCGVYYNLPPCIMEDILAQCTASCWCSCVNTNGWGLSVCDPSAATPIADTDTFVLNGTKPPGPVGRIPQQDDAHFPPEEPAEALSNPAPVVTAMSLAGQWAILQTPGGGRLANVTVGGVWNNVWLLQAVIDPSPDALLGLLAAAGDTAAPSQLPRSALQGLAALRAASAGGPIAVVELESARWGQVVGLAAASASPVAVLRQGAGAAGQLEQQRFNMTAVDECFYSRVGAQADDFLAHLLWAETPDSLEPTVQQSLSLLPPMHDYQLLGVPDSPVKWVAAQNGVVKRADGPVYTPLTAGNDTGPGTTIFSPALAVPWPAAPFNWTDYKSSRLGRVLSTVHIAMRLRPELSAPGAPAMAMTLSAFAPSLSNSTQVLVRTAVLAYPSECGMGAGSPPCPSRFWAASNGESQRALPDGSLFFTALLAQNALWVGAPSGPLHGSSAGGLLDGAMRVQLPGQEGQRLADMGVGMLVSSQSVYLGLTPNYGFGEYYWSPQLDRGGSLPLTTLALNNALLDWGLYERAAELVGYYWDVDVMADGTISMAGWKPACPFPDGLSDYGRMLQLWTRVARAIEGSNATWVEAHYPKTLAMAQYMLGLLAAAPRSGVAPGLIIGPAEHDTCQDQEQYFSINMWMWRGLRDFGRYLNETGRDEVTAAKVSAVAAAFAIDLRAAVDSSWVANNVTGDPLFFLPPIAGPGQTPFATMTGSTLESYSNFRYFSETLLSGFLRAEEAAALSEFRTTHGGSVSGITRWSDHLDDMPAAGYARASLELDRMPFFHLFLVGHTMNYQSRGVFASTEQIGYFQQPNAAFREYLAAPSERDVDMCVPSSQLVSELVPWALVADVSEDNSVWLLKGALRRWFNASFARTGPAPSQLPAQGDAAATTTVAAVGAHSRYGRLNLTVTATDPSPSNGGIALVASVDIALTGRGYVVSAFGVPQTAAPVLRLRLRDPGSTGERSLSGVTAAGDCEVLQVDPVLEVVTLQLQTGTTTAGVSGPAGALSCSVRASLEQPGVVA